MSDFDKNGDLVKPEAESVNVTQLLQEQERWLLAQHQTSEHLRRRVLEHHAKQNGHLS